MSDSVVLTHFIFGIAVPSLAEHHHNLVVGCAVISSYEVIYVSNIRVCVRVGPPLIALGP